KLWRTWVGVMALAAVGLAGAAVAAGAGSTKAGTTTTATTTTAKPARTPENALSGDVLAKVKAAAVAKTGGTVDSVTTENDGSDAAAAYEVHETKANGSHLTVTLDKSNAALSVETHAGRPDHARRH